MTRIGFLLIGLAAVVMGINAAGITDGDYVDVAPVVVAVAGALSIAIDAERDDAPRSSREREPVTLGGGGRFGPLTRLGFAVIGVGVIIMALRITGVTDSESADIASVGAMVVGAVVVAVDGEREIRPD